MKTLKYSEYTQTMRLWPDNYCLAYKENGKWYAYKHEGATRNFRWLIAVVCFFVNLFN